MPKQDASKGKKEVFAWHLLQFKRFRGLAKFNEKWTSKCHEKSNKMRTLGTLGMDCWDFGRFLGDLEFYVFYDLSIDPKISKNLQTIQKWGESDAKGGDVAKIRNESGPGEGLLGLKGGTPSWHQLGQVSITRASSGPTFCWCQFSHRLLMTCWRPSDPQKLQKFTQKRAKMPPKPIPKLSENYHGK
jgi:hypothetical protein